VIFQDDFDLFCFSLFLELSISWNSSCSCCMLINQATQLTHHSIKKIHQARWWECRHRVRDLLLPCSSVFSRAFSQSMAQWSQFCYWGTWLKIWTPEFPLWLVSMRMHVQFLALLSGLRIRHCHRLQMQLAQHCHGCGVARQLQFWFNP